jgi:3-mercaptopyruvate sulfurtransferase SseA
MPAARIQPMSPTQVLQLRLGGRASQAWLVLTYLLGYPNVQVDDGSWIEWGHATGRAHREVRQV